MSAQLFADLLARSEGARLVVLIADTPEAGRKCAEAGVAESEQPDLPVWGWDAGQGLHHLAGSDGPPGLRPGTGKDAPASAVRAVQKWNQEAVLLVFGADKLTDPDQLGPLLTKQIEDDQLVPWLVLITQGGDLSAAFAATGADTATFELDIRGRSTSHVRGAKRAAMNPRDIHSLQSFRTDEWGRYLDELPPGKLREIGEDPSLYEASLDRVTALGARLKKVFVDKDEVIDMMLSCSVAQLPMLMLGPWGTGKSMLVRQLSVGLGIAPDHRRIDTEDEMLSELAALAGEENPVKRHDEAKRVLFDGRETRHFEYLVTRFTTPEELIGTVNIDVLLKFALHLRQTRGLMPRAEIVFLDEVFKANSAILNALLSLIHERLIYNAGVPWRVKLVMLFGASNEPPQDTDLGAFFDRFPVRVLCRAVGNDRLQELLDHAHTQQFLGLVPKGANAADVNALAPGNAFAERRVTALACVNDFRLLHKVALYKFGGAKLADSTPASQEFLKRYLQAFRHLRDPFGISDRSCAHFYRLARARALLGVDRKQRPTEPALAREDIRVLRYCGRDAEELRKLPGILEQFV